MAKAPKERGRPLLAALVGHLTGPDSPVGDPAPMDGAALRAFEEAMGVAASPSMAALLGFDRGFAERDLGWFRAAASEARPAVDLVGDFVGPLREAFEQLFARRLPGRALPLEAGSESMRFLYLGDPDALGEYPVLFVDVDDLPMIGVDDAGFDTWLGRRLGLLGPRAFADDVKAAAKRMFGRQTPLEMPDFEKKLPKPVAGPAPGSARHAPIAAPPAKKARPMTDAQVTKGLKEHATSGNLRRLEELIADAKTRGLPAAAIDAALVEAAYEGPLAAVEMLLGAGGNPRARDTYGCALARAAQNDDDQVHRALLAAGADPNGPSVNGKTALHEVVEQGKVELVRAYLAHGADARRADSVKRSALHHALCASPPLALPPPEMVDLLAPLSDLEKGPPLVVSAVEMASAEHVRRLLAAGADPNRKSDYLKRDALHAAFDGCRDDLAPMLVAAGADRKARDGRGIALLRIYGEAGEDVRPIDVAIAASTRPQKLAIDLSIAVTNVNHLAHFSRASLQGSHWAKLASYGLLGGGHLTAKREPKLAAITAAGPAELSMELEIAELFPPFLEWMLGAMMIDVLGVRTGVGMDPVVRVIGLTARGSATGPSVVSAEAVRRVARTPWTAFDGPAAGASIARGDAPGIVGTFDAAPDAAQVAAFAELCRTWMATQPTWSWDGGEWLGAWSIDWGDPRVEGVTATLRLSEYRNGKRPVPWGYGPGAAALFAQMAARFPARVVLTLPP